MTFEELEKVKKNQNNTPCICFYADWYGIHYFNMNIKKSIDK